MSTIAFERHIPRAFSKSCDGLIIVLYLVLALGILVGLHGMAGTTEEGRLGFEFASAM